MGKRKIAVGSWAYIGGGSPLGLEGMAEKLAALGFDGVALFGAAPHADPALFPERGDRLRLRNLFFDHHLEVLETVPDVWRLNPLTREAEYVGYMENYIRFMDDCGFRLLRVDTCCPPQLPDGMGRDRALDAIVAIFRHLAKRCAARNLSVVWEFEPGFIFNKPAEVTRILDAVGMANFNLLFDTCHAQLCAGGDVGEFIRMVSGKIGAVHLADTDGTLHPATGTTNHVPFGAGVVDFDVMLPALLGAGKYEFGWWTIDLIMPENWQATVEAKKFVDALNARYS